jgi:hypothetical protein
MPPDSSHGMAILEPREPEAVQQLQGAFAIVGPPVPEEFRLQQHVVEDRAPVEEDVPLEHDPELVGRAL